MNATLSTQSGSAIAAQRTLSDLKRGDSGAVAGVRPVGPADPIAMRLEDLGFVPGENVRLVSLGPVGGDPLVVQIGFTRFALRRAEADRILMAGSP